MLRFTKFQPQSDKYEFKSYNIEKRDLIDFAVHEDIQGRTILLVNDLKNIYEVDWSNID